MKNEKVGELLKELRIKNKLTQAELAKKVGVTYQAVSRWEKGINTPNLETLVALKNLYGISVDELLLEVKINEPESVQSQHWGLRFFIYPLLLFYLLIFIAQFYLFLNTTWSMIFMALFITLLFMPIIGFVQVKKRGHFYLIFLALLLILNGAIYFSNKHYYDLMSVPELRVVEKNQFDIDYNDQFPISIRFTSGEHDYVLIYSREVENMNLYDLSLNIDSMYSKIDTQDKKVKSVSIFEDMIYYLTNDGIYRFVLDTKQLELVISTSENYELFSDGYDLYMVTRATTTLYQEDSVYKLEDDSLIHWLDFDFQVQHIVYSEFYESFFISYYKSEPLSTGIFNTAIYDRNFDLQHTIFSDGQITDNIELKENGSKILASADNEIFTLFYTEIEETELTGTVDNIHNTGGSFYEKSGFLLDAQWNYLGDDAIVGTNWRPTSCQLLYKREIDLKYVCIEQNEVSLLNPTSKQITELFISSYLRHILLVASLPLIALIVSNGVKVKKK